MSMWAYVGLRHVARSPGSGSRWRSGYVWESSRDVLRAVEYGVCRRRERAGSIVGPVPLGGLVRCLLVVKYSR